LFQVEAKIMARTFLLHLKRIEDPVREVAAKSVTRGLIVALLLISVGPASWGQRPKHSLKTFTAPDGTFQFTYSSILTQCKLQPQRSGDGYYWAQPECSAYIPLCEGVPDQPIACIAYPHNRYTNSDTFDGATFSVEETGENERDCLNPPDTNAKEIVIRGVKFRAFESADVAMNRARDARGYATFHHGKCYNLGITVVTTNAQVFDPPAKELTKKQWDEVNRRLEQARDSFRFLK
jgi:hypothetical protein